MSLSVKITSYQRLTPNQQSVYRAASDSFTIGRNHENDWAIPDPQRFLSGVHCRISQKNNDWFITDTSTNGVFLNGSEARLTRNQPVALNPGDRFRIGDYEFEIIIEDESMAGNPLTANEETMTGADPFDDPFPAPGTPRQAEPVSHADPFDDDPFAEAVPDKHVVHADMDFMSDLEKPISSLGDNPLAGHVSIDSLMGFDDVMDFEEPESAAKLEQRRTPLREAFKPAGLSGAPSPPRAASPPPATSRAADTFQAAFPDEFPDDWDESTGMLKIPQQEEPFGPAGSDIIPDDWDEATGMLKVQAPPAPPRAVTPAPPAPPPPPAPAAPRRWPPAPTPESARSPPPAARCRRRPRR